MQKRTFLKMFPLSLFGIFQTSKAYNQMARPSTTGPLPKKIAYIVFDKITLLDLVGMYDPISWLKSMGYLPDLAWDICSFTGPVRDSFGFEIQVDQIQPDLSEYDTLIIPGGFGTRPLQHDKAFIDWVKTAQSAQYKISVCTGALILGAAGYLEGKTATTNASAFDLLTPYCQHTSKEKVVEDGNVITAGGVSSSLNLGLYLCEKWAGTAARKAIQQKMDFECFD